MGREKVEVAFPVFPIPKVPGERPAFRGIGGCQVNLPSEINGIVPLMGRS